jgi:hypothetical protein
MLPFINRTVISVNASTFEVHVMAEMMLVVGELKTVKWGGLQWFDIN